MKHHKTKKKSIKKKTLTKKSKTPIPIPREYLRTLPIIHPMINETYDEMNLTLATSLENGDFFNSSETLF